MYLKQLLSLAAIAGVSATNSHNLVENNDERMLQASLGCMVGGTPAIDCCPTVDPDDGICSLLWCVKLDDLSVKDGCGCGQIETACGLVASLATMFPDLTGMCSQVVECCDDGTATNDGFNTCMGTAIDNGNVTIPDFASIIPGGVPDFGAIVEAGETDSVTSTTSTEPSSETTVAGEPSSETTVAGSTEAPTDGTGATEPPAATTEAPAIGSSPAAPDGTNNANKYAISTLMSLVGSSLAILFV